MEKEKEKEKDGKEKAKGKDRKDKEGTNEMSYSELIDFPRDIIIQKRLEMLIRLAKNPPKQFEAKKKAREKALARSAPKRSARVAQKHKSSTHKLSRVEREDVHMVSEPDFTLPFPISSPLSELAEPMDDTAPSADSSNFDSVSPVDNAIHEPTQLIGQVATSTIKQPIQQFLPSSPVSDPFVALLPIYFG